MISIIVPIYNTEKYLPKCIESVVQQTYQDLEIILVDDGSADCSGEICEEYARKDTRIRVIHKENGGLVSARQAGIRIASGEYVGFVDSDDWVEQGMYETLYSAARLENADAVSEGAIDDFDGRCTVTLNQTVPGRYAAPDEREGLYGDMLCCRDFFALGMLPYLWNKIFRREIVRRHMMGIPRSIRVGEDAAAVYPMLAMSGSIVVLGSAHYHYCHRKDSMMLGETDEGQEYANTVRLHSFLERSFAELGLYGLVRRQLGRYTVNNLLARSYGKVADMAMDAGSALFPFSGICGGDSVIIYGAGALGRAVHQYACASKELAVKALVDQNAPSYRRIGLDVHTLDEIDIGKPDKVAVAVFDEDAYKAISRSLVRKGVKKEQIKWIDGRINRIGVPKTGKLFKSGRMEY